MLQNNRVTGAFIGLAVGDALGAPVEFMERGSFPKITEMLPGGYFQLPAGAWTDDTAQALCLADSLLSNAQFDPADFMQRLHHWMNTAHNTSTGTCVGVGQNTFRVVGNFMRTGEYFAPPTKQKSDGNGAIMRLAPVICAYWPQYEACLEIAEKQSRVTHYSDISADAAKYLAALISNLLTGCSWQDALKQSKLDKLIQPVSDIAKCTWKSKTVSDISSSGYVVNTLEAAIWAVDRTNSFEETLVTAVNLGNDADTVGAVAGQIAGALYGYSEIPDQWLARLARKDHLLNIAQKLDAMS